MRLQERQGLQGALAHALDRHFVACAAVAAAATVASQAQNADAAIVYSGVQDYALTGGAGETGLYIDLVGKSPNNGSSYQLNPYINATSSSLPSDNDMGMYTGSATSVVDGGAAAGAAKSLAKLAAGTTIGPASTFTSGTGTVVATPDNGGAPWDAASNGSDFMGFQFSNAAVNGGSPVYGWLRIYKPAGAPQDSSSIVIHDWAYDDSGAAITAGAGVPEPTSLALLAMGAIGLTMRRGRGKVQPVA